MRAKSEEMKKKNIELNIAEEEFCNFDTKKLYFYPHPHLLKLNKRQ